MHTCPLNSRTWEGKDLGWKLCGHPFPSGVYLFSFANVSQRTGTARSDFIIIFFLFGAGNQASSYTCKVHIIPSYDFNLKKYILLDSVLSTHVAAQQLSVPPDSRESDGLF